MGSSICFENNQFSYIKNKVFRKYVQIINRLNSTCGWHNDKSEILLIRIDIRPHDN